MTIGDILAIVAAVVGICVSAWALMVTCGLMFPAKAETARQVLLSKPKACIGLGVGLALVPGFLGVVMLGSPHPGLKLLGMLGILTVLGCGALGGAGVSFVAGDRIQSMAPELSDYAVFVRGAGFLVVGSIFPIVGWFAFGPIALFAAVGSGARAVLRGTSVVRQSAEPLA
jgi:hypothetical protein